MDIRCREIEHKFIERAKTNATFVLDTAKYCRRARIVSSMDSRGAQQMAYGIEKDLDNIDMFQIYFERYYGDYGKYELLTMRVLYDDTLSISIFWKIKNITIIDRV